MVSNSNVIDLLVMVGSWLKALAANDYTPR
jgi:hypothetical protein